MPPRANTAGTVSTDTSKGASVSRMASSSAASAGPSARRAALPSSGRRSQAASPTIRRKNRSAAASAGSRPPEPVVGSCGRPDGGGVDGQRVTGAVVAATVVGDGVQVAEPAEHPGEAGRAIEGPVDHDHHRLIRTGIGGEVLVDGEFVGRWHLPAQPVSSTAPMPFRGVRGRWSASCPVRQLRTPPAETALIRGSGARNAHIEPPDRALLGLPNDEGETVPLTKTDLIAAVAAHTGATAKDVATILGGSGGVVVANVAKGEKVVLTGFLTSQRAQRAARTGRNPQTGEAIKIKASKSPKVSAGASFKKVVNGQAPAPKPVSYTHLRAHETVLDIV